MSFLHIFLKKSLFICGMLLTLLSMHPVLAQDNTRLFYLAQIDSNQNNAFTEEDLTHLFMWDGVQSQALSSAEVGSVQFYAADAHYIAFISQKGAEQFLSVTTLDTKSTVTQPLSSAAITQITLTHDLVWIVTRSDDDKPLVVGYDPITLTVTAQRAAKLGDTRLSLQGDWVFAYNPSGLINVFALPSLDPVSVELEDYSLTVPMWSPSQTQFQYLAANADAMNDQFIALVDLATGQSRRLDVPDAPSDAFSQAVWSGNGAYLVFHSSIEEDTLRLINITSREQTVLSEPGYKLTPFIWSDNDRWLVYEASSTLDLSSELILYDRETGQNTLLKNPNTQSITLSWSPDNNKLAVLGQFGDQGQYGVFTLSAPTFDQWQLQISGDVSVAQGGFIWLDSDHLVLTQNGTLLLLEIPTGILTPLTDKTQQVIANRVSQR